MVGEAGFVELTAGRLSCDIFKVASFTHKISKVLVGSMVALLIVIIVGQEDCRWALAKVAKVDVVCTKVWNIVSYL